MQEGGYQVSVIGDCLENIKANRGEVIDLDTLSTDDQATYDLLARGDTLGVFQLDGGGLRALLRLAGPVVVARMIGLRPFTPTDVERLVDDFLRGRLADRA